MACEATQVALSAAADGEAVAVDRAHVDACPDCAAFDAGIRRLRTALRFGNADEIPDVSAAVLARVTAPARPAPRRPRLLPVAAALLAGVVAGSLVTRTGSERPSVAAALPTRVTAAQSALHALSADLTVVEHGPERRRTGTIRYVAPEQLVVRLDGTTLWVADDGWRLDGPGGSRAVRGREPFAAAAPAPLDLVLPASGFLVGERAATLPERRIGDRRAVGTVVTAAQVAALLDALRPGGDGRPVHPADEVELWLDAVHLTPLEVSVRAGGGPDRARWAAARRLDDRPGEVVLEARFAEVVVNDRRAAGTEQPDLAGAPDAGFRDGPAPDAPEPAWLPAGMRPHRSGTVGDVAVRSWTDGRAWLKVRATRAWGGDRLFGGLGPLVRRVTTAAGPLHLDDAGGVVAVHARGVDLVVTGSVPTGDLVRVAASLPVRPLPLPDGWAEARGAADPAVLPLRLPSAAGLPDPAVRVDGGTIIASYAGDGDRGLLLTTRPASSLAPPLEPDVVGVRVRGTAGRWSPDRAELEWIEDGRRWAMRSRTVGLAELVTLAEGLRP